MELKPKQEELLENLVKSEPKKLVWEQKIKAERGFIVVTTPIEDMTIKHLQNAKYKCQHTIDRLCNEINKYEELLNRIEAVALGRGVELDEYTPKTPCANTIEKITEETVENKE